MKRLFILAFAAACGSSSPKPATPEATTGSAAATAVPAAQANALLGLGEIVIHDGAKDVVRVHANGDTEVLDDGGKWQTLGKISVDGSFTTPDHQTGKLQPDGSFTTPDGPAPFKLDGAALVGTHHRITIEDGKLVGADSGAAGISITGALDDGTKRTALLLIGILLSSSSSDAHAGSAAVSPAAK